MIDIIAIKVSTHFEGCFSTVHERYFSIGYLSGLTFTSLSFIPLLRKSWEVRLVDLKLYVTRFLSNLKEQKSIA